MLRPGGALERLCRFFGYGGSRYPKLTKLGGGNSNIFLNVYPEIGEDELILTM